MIAITIQYRSLRGSQILIIFQKYLEYKGTTTFKWINELIKDLLDKNMEKFILKLHNDEASLAHNPDLNKYFWVISREYYWRKVKQHEK